MPWCSYAQTLFWLHAPMFTCIVDHMLLCSHASMIVGSLMYVIFFITYPLAYMPSSSYAQTDWWLPTPMLKYFDYCMLTCIDIYMFEIHTNVHTCGSWNVYWFGGISDHVIGGTCAQMLRRLCLNAEESGRIEVCVLGCLNAQILTCLYGHMSTCLYALMLKCS